MSTIVDLAKQNRLSLAVLKPKEVLDLTYEKINLEGLNEKKKMLEKKYEADRMQPNLFQDPESLDYSFQFAEQIPYRFKYVFTTKDCKKREIMVEDWEIGMLYRNCFKKYQDEIRACEKVRNKYLGFKDNDLLFFMGTSYEWQKRNSPNPFLIIGVFPAKKGTFERGRQLKLPL